MTRSLKCRARRAAPTSGHDTGVETPALPIALALCLREEIGEPLTLSSPDATPPARYAQPVWRGKVMSGIERDSRGDEIVVITEQRKEGVAAALASAVYGTGSAATTPPHANRLTRD